MAKQSGQKLKILVLYQTLLARSDEDHPLTVQELIDALAKQDISAERKSIYTDLEALISFGVDIQCRKGKIPGWYIASRDFELPELKLLVDAVQSSKFITTRKSDALIKKLEGLASRYEATQLQRQVYVDRRVKTMNESIYYNVDKLHTAIAAQKAV
ncbi:MAG: WYL domain-containing protein, partial [Oscillospiraceae bacterium]